MIEGSDRSLDFDRNWHGPEDLKPKVYRTQLEKDVWHGCVVDNEYKLGQLQESDTVVDLGAHIGAFSFLAHRNGSRRIFAFEVDPWHLQAARENLGGLYGVSLNHYAVVRSDAARLPQYHYNGNWEVFSGRGAPVASVSLDEILKDVGPVRFLKIDVEGSEWPILYTCTKLDQVQEIAGECHADVQFDDPSLPPKTPEALLRFLVDSPGRYTEVEWRAGSENTWLFWARR
jgi:FkbM family methyltransferase